MTSLEKATALLRQGLTSLASIAASLDLLANQTKLKKVRTRTYPSEVSKLRRQVKRTLLRSDRDWGPEIISVVRQYVSDNRDRFTSTTYEDGYSAITRSVSRETCAGRFLQDGADAYVAIPSCLLARYTRQKALSDNLWKEMKRDIRPKPLRIAYKGPVQRCFVIPQKYLNGST